MEAGYNVYSPEDIKVPPHLCILGSTNIAIQVPPGAYGRIDRQSSLLVRNCIYMCAEVIDKDYRGQNIVLLINDSDTEFPNPQDDQIDQLILEQIKPPDAKTVRSVQSTE